MKKTLYVTLLVLITSKVLAGDIAVPPPPHGGVSAGVSSSNVTGSSASNQGVSQAINFNTQAGNSNNKQAYAGGYKLETVPSMSAPSLTTTFSETCMGSTTGSAGWLGFGGSLGSTWKDEECIRRLNAIMLANTLHEYAASKELMCGNAEINMVFTALERATGKPVSCLMDPSDSIAIPGGALKNYREIRPGKRYVPPPPPPVVQSEPPQEQSSYIPPPETKKMAPQ